VRDLRSRDADGGLVDGDDRASDGGRASGGDRDTGGDRAASDDRAPRPGDDRAATVG
jgi:hypothetical protein